MKKADNREHGAYHRHLQQHSPGHLIHPWEIARSNQEDDGDDEDAPLPIGLFGSSERAMFTAEILYQVVIGMGKLDDEPPSQEESQTPTGSTTQTQAPDGNPYFPSLPPNATSPGHIAPHPNMQSAQMQSNDRNAFSPGTEFPPNADQSSDSDYHMDVDSPMYVS